MYGGDDTLSYHGLEQTVALWVASALLSSAVCFCGLVGTHILPSCAQFFPCALLQTGTACRLWHSLGLAHWRCRPATQVIMHGAWQHGLKVCEQCTVVASQRGVSSYSNCSGTLLEERIHSRRPMSLVESEMSVQCLHATASRNGRRGRQLGEGCHGAAGHSIIAERLNIISTQCQVAMSAKI
jgi:hypothetical protein